MKLKQRVLMAGALALLLGSCADESPWGTGSSSGSGTIKLYLSSATDLSSEMPKVRSVSTDIVAPSISEFSIRLSSQAGDYIKVWNSVTEFEKETDFKAGNYILEAYYGSSDSQGIVKEGEAGYEHSYYYGKENVTVEAGKEANIQVVTTLKNAVVAIEYTDAFKNYFSSWDTQLITRGENSLHLGEDEGLCYVIPGNVDVVIDATQQNGKSVKLNPAIFEAEAQHLYKITYNVYGGEIGHAETLQLIFNDMPDDDHTIEIDLTDELLKGEGPVIQTDGFETNGVIETLSGSTYDGVVRFNIDSPDGYTEALLTIKSESYEADFLTDGVIDLYSATELQKAQLEDAGIKVLGLWGENPRLAMVDMTAFCKNLEVGEHDITLRVKDRSRVADATVKLITYPISVKVEAAGPTIFGRRYADVTLSYNGSDPTAIGNNPFSFKIRGNGEFEDTEIRSIKEETETRSFESKNYVYRIAAPDSETDEYTAEIYFNNGTAPVASTKIAVDYPKYEVAYDPMATKVMLKVMSVDDSEIDFSKADIRDLFFKRLRVFIDGVENKDVKKNEMTYVAVASGLPAVTPTFTAKTSLAINPENYPHSEEVTLNYEAQAAVPNGDFSETENLLINPINIGGEWTVSPKTYQTQSIINRQVPSGVWATVNPLTCYTGGLGGATPNTWGTEPGTYVDGDNVLIMTVGYSLIPISLGTTGGIMNTKYYNTNSPNDLSAKAGELFLGSYSFNGESSREMGVNFNSRPSSFIFDYSYSPINSETGFFYISLLDDQGSILMYEERDLTSSIEFQTIEIPFGDYEFLSSVSTLNIYFSSSKSEEPSISIPSDLDEGVTVRDMSGILTQGNNLMRAENTYKAFAKGSQLRIKNLKFTY